MFPEFSYNTVVPFVARVDSCDVHKLTDLPLTIIKLSRYHVSPAKLYIGKFTLVIKTYICMSLFEILCVNNYTSILLLEQSRLLTPRAVTCQSKVVY